MQQTIIKIHKNILKFLTVKKTFIFVDLEAKVASRIQNKRSILAPSIILGWKFANLRRFASLYQQNY